MSSNVRRRRRTVEERLGASVRHLRPGNLAGRGEPLPRDRGATRVSGGPAGAGEDGSDIEHVTLLATASQTIASGSADLGFDRIAGPPTERRGFETLSARLAADGEVFAIPVDVTGVLNFNVEGMWANWRGSGLLTVKRTRDSDVVSETYDLARFGPHTRAFGGADDGWEVRAGDTMTYQLPNGSGSDQTLSWARLVQKIIEVSSPTSDAQVPTSLAAPSTWDYDSVDIRAGEDLNNLACPNAEVGDMLIVWGGAFDFDGQGLTTAPAGWTEIVTRNTTNDAHQVWWKIADSDDLVTIGPGWTVPGLTSASRGCDYTITRVPGATAVAQSNTATTSMATLNVSLSGIDSGSLVVGLLIAQFSPGPSFQVVGGDLTSAIELGGNVGRGLGHVQGSPSVTATASVDEDSSMAVLELTA